MELAEVLEWLGWGYAAQGRHPAALAAVRRRVALDPLHEPAHRQLMQLYVEAGQQGEALRQYGVCVQILQDELGIPPSPETNALLEAIKAGKMQPARSPASQNSRLPQKEARPEPAPGWRGASHETPPADTPPIFLTSQAPSPVAERTVFVARRVQLMQLRNTLNRMLAGKGQIHFIIGEAGSGKTSLLHEFARQAQETVPDLVVAGGVCSAYAGIGDPYLALREILAMLSGDVESRWLAGAISRHQALRLWSLLPHTVEALLDEGPNLLDTFVQGAALASRARLHSPTAQAWRTRLQMHLAQEQRRTLDQSRIFEEYTRVLCSLARSRPLLLLLDDLHWADASSLNLLFHLGRHLGSSRVMVIGAYRPEDVALGWHGKPHPLGEAVQEFQQQYGDIHTRLESEATAEGRHFVDALLDITPNQLDEAFRQALFRQSGGHAFFTSELLRDLQERGTLVQDEGGEWRKGSTLDWRVLPVRVEGVIARRLERLDARAREVLSVASVAGEDFTAEAVARVLALDERQLVQLLGNELGRRHRLVQAQEVRSLGPRRLSLYRFRHNLFQTYLYNSLDVAEQQYLHEAIGTALEELYGEEQGQLARIAGQLAHHFQQAGQVEKAIAYRLLAGKQAVQVAANQEAMDHLQTGLALLQTLPDSLENMRQELALQLALGVPVTALQGYGHSDVERIYSRAYALGLHLGETDQLFPALYGLCRMAGIRGELQATRGFGQQLLDLAQKTQDSSQAIEAYRTAGINSHHLGEFATARPLLEQVLALYDPQQHGHHAYLFGHDPAVSCLGYLSHLLWLLGYPVQAQEKVQQLLQFVQTLDHPFSTGHAYVFGAAILAQWRREAPLVQNLAQVGIALAAEHRFPFWQAMGDVLLGWSLAQQGQLATGIDQMHNGLARWHAGEAKLFTPYFLGLLAEGYSWAGEFGAGLDALDNALALVEQTGERWCEAELHRLRGELQWLQGAPPVEVETQFQQALLLARVQQAKSLELRASISLCRLWRSQDKRGEARLLLAAIYGWFPEGLDTADLKEARTVLEELA
jgi:predicted ATPase